MVRTVLFFIGVALLYGTITPAHCAVLPRVLYAKSLRPWRHQPGGMYEQVRPYM